eukprot:scaffold42953_cov22-Tisochrysis_lutea.AAC.1
MSSAFLKPTPHWYVNMKGTNHETEKLLPVFMTRKNKRPDQGQQRQHMSMVCKTRLPIIYVGRLVTICLPEAGHDLVHNNTSSFCYPTGYSGAGHDIVQERTKTVYAILEATCVQKRYSGVGHDLVILVVSRHVVIPSSHQSRSREAGHHLVTFSISFAPSLLILPGMVSLDMILFALASAFPDAWSGYTVGSYTLLSCNTRTCLPVQEGSRESRTYGLGKQ